MTSWLLRTDNLTYALGIVAAGVFVATKWAEPVPLLPPLILGRQSDVSRTRQPGESATFRNYGTGFMSAVLPARPHRDVRTVNDLLRDDLAEPRTLWGTKITNAELKQRVTAFASGLAQSANLIPRTSRVLILLNDSLEWLVADLALAHLQVASFTLASLNVLSDLVDQHTPNAIIVDAAFVEQLLELIAESHEFHQQPIIVVGSLSPEAQRSATHIGVTLTAWADIATRGADKPTTVPAASQTNGSSAQSDLHTVLQSIVFSRAANNDIQVTQFTQENLTAGVVATHFLLPYQNALSPKDSVVSAFPVSTTFGRSVLYSALYNGASFTTVGSAKVISTAEQPARDLADILSTIESQRAPSPTVLFVTRQHLNSITKSVLSVVNGLLKPLAWRHKSAALAAGALSNDTLFDRLVFQPARRAALGPMGSTLRAVVVAGGPVDAATLPASRIALSVPVVVAHTHTLAAGAVFGSHPLDVQNFPVVDGDELSSLAHLGPPATNVEVKLAGVTEEDGGKPIVGSLQFRGPSIGTPGLGELRPSSSQQWVEAGETAAVQTNGSFKVIPFNL